MEHIGDYERTFTTKKGRQVLIRSLRRDEDVDELLRFINELVDEDIFINMTRRVSKGEESEWLSGRLRALEEGRGFNLLAFHGRRIVANAGLDRLSGRSGHVGGLGIAVSRGFRDEGIGSELLRELMRLAKDSLNLKMLTLHVFSANERAVHVYEKLGFERCGRLPGAIFWQGDFIDDVLMYRDLVE